MLRCNEVIRIELRHVVVRHLCVRAFLRRGDHPSMAQIRHLPIAVLHHLGELGLWVEIY